MKILHAPFKDPALLRHLNNGSYVLEPWCSNSPESEIGLVVCVKYLEGDTVIVQKIDSHDFNAFMHPLAAKKVAEVQELNPPSITNQPKESQASVNQIAINEHNSGAYIAGVIGGCLAAILTIAVVIQLFVNWNTKRITYPQAVLLAFPLWAVLRLTVYYLSH